MVGLYTTQVRESVFFLVNPRSACAKGLKYLLFVCLSVTKVVAKSFVYTLKVRYVQVPYRLILIIV